MGVPAVAWSVTAEFVHSNPAVLTETPLQFSRRRFKISFGGHRPPLQLRSTYPIVLRIPATCSVAG